MSIVNARPIVDDAANINLQASCGCTIAYKLQNPATGDFVNISGAILYLEISGQPAIQLTAGPDVYTQMIIIPDAVVLQLSVTQPTPFVLRDTTVPPVCPPWSGLINLYGMRSGS